MCIFLSNCLKQQGFWWINDTRLLKAVVTCWEQATKCLITPNTLHHNICFALHICSHKIYNIQSSVTAHNCLTALNCVIYHSFCHLGSVWYRGFYKLATFLSDLFNCYIDNLLLLRCVRWNSSVLLFFEHGPSLFLRKHGGLLRNPVLLFGLDHCRKVRRREREKKKRFSNFWM